MNKYAFIHDLKALKDCKELYIAGLIFKIANANRNEKRLETTKPDGDWINKTNLLTSK